jgi:hypothetical protein
MPTRLEAKIRLPSSRKSPTIDTTPSTSSAMTTRTSLASLASTRLRHVPGFPSDYNYDDKFGIKVVYDGHGERRDISISPDEMTAPDANTGPVLFGHFAKPWRARIHLAISRCK